MKSLNLCKQSKSLIGKTKSCSRKIIQNFTLVNELN